MILSMAAFAVLYGHIKTLLFQEALHQLKGDALIQKTHLDITLLSWGDLLVMPFEDDLCRLLKWDIH